MCLDFIANVFGKNSETSFFEGGGGTMYSQLSNICYFCFHFTFTVCTNVLNTVDFVVRKGKKKSI